MKQITQAAQRRAQERVRTAEAERQRSLAFMQTPNDWPCWPRLPLKMKDTTMIEGKLGFLVDGAGPTVYMGNIFQQVLPPAALTKVFSSFDEVVETGWRVD